MAPSTTPSAPAFVTPHTLTPASSFTPWLGTLYTNGHNYSVTSTPHIWGIITLFIIVFIVLIDNGAIHAIVQHYITKPLKKMYLLALDWAVFAALNSMDEPKTDLEKTPTHGPLTPFSASFSGSTRTGTKEEPILQWTDHQGNIINVKYHKIGGWRPIGKANVGALPSATGPLPAPFEEVHEITPKVIEVYIENLAPSDMSSNRGHYKVVLPLGVKDVIPRTISVPIVVPRKLAEHTAKKCYITSEKESNTPI